MGKKLRYEYVKSVVEGKGGELLSKGYKDSNTKLDVKCSKCDYIWQPTFGSISQDVWCPKCVGKPRYTFEEVIRMINDMGGTFLSGEYKNSRSKLRVKCNKCNYKWETTRDSIRQNKWCTKCRNKEHGVRSRHNIEKVRKLIDDKGGILLSKEYKHKDVKLHVKCLLCNHKWFPTFNSIRSGAWCPVCAGNAKFTYKYVKSEIENRNGILLSKKYKNSSSKIEVKCCLCNNIWNPTFGSIHNAGYWCPGCCIGKSQKKITEIIKNIFREAQVLVNYNDLDWLYNKKTKKKQEIDIYVPGLKLAIEYDGQQHFFPVRFGGISKEQAEKNFKRTKYNDRRKNRLMKNHPEDINYFVRFNYKEKLTKEYVIGKLIKNGIPINNNDQNNQK